MASEAPQPLLIIAPFPKVPEIKTGNAAYDEETHALILDNKSLVQVRDPNTGVLITAQLYPEGGAGVMIKGETKTIEPGEQEVPIHRSVNGVITASHIID